MKKNLLYSIFGILTVGILMGYSSGAGDSGQFKTGAPTEGTCNDCHGGGAFGTVTPVVEVLNGTTNVTSYCPNTTYTVRITINETGTATPSGYGFQITALNSSNQRAGTFIPGTNQRVLVNAANSRQYCEHTQRLTSNIITMQWTSAANVGNITFYAAGNCVNGAGTVGDLAGTSTKVLTASSLTAALTSSNNITCGIPTATLTATGGTNYNFGSGFSTIATKTVTAAGTYTVTVQNAAGCTATSTVAVTANTTPPTVTTNSTAATCSSQGTATATGGTAYVWSNFVTTPTITAGAGTYTVTVVGANNCTATRTVTIANNTTPPTVTAVSSNNLNCINSSATLTATPATGVSYMWSGGGTNATKTVTAAGIYTVTVTNASNGCTATSAVVVTQNTTPPPVSITTTTHVPCQYLFVGTAMNYQWNTGSTAPNISVSNSGTYSVTVTGTNGCTATSTVMVTVPPVIITQTGNTLTTLAGANSYQWFLNGTAIAGATSASYTPTATGNYTVQLNSDVACNKTSTPYTYTYVSTNNLVDNKTVNLFPNPTNGIFDISFSDKITTEQFLTISNLMGQNMLSLTIPRATLQKTVNLSAMEAGIYFVHLKDSVSGESSTFKILIEK